MLELPSIFVDVLLPVFGIAAVGVMTARRWGVSYQPLSTIAYRVLTPAFIFDVLSDPAAAEGPVIRMVGASLGTVLVLWVVLGVFLRGKPGERRVLDSMASTFGNVGNLGFPIVLFGLGDEALASATIHFLAITIGVFTLGVAAAARLRSGSLGDALKRVALTPAIAVAPIALVAGNAGWEFPTAVDRFVGLLAAAMIPVMLLTLGMQLAGAHFTRDAARLVGIGLTKLVVKPAVFVGMAALFGLTGTARDTGVLLAAMPTAVLVGLISLEFDLETEVASAAILATSLVALVSLAVLLRIM